MHYESEFWIISAACCIVLSNKDIDLKTKTCCKASLLLFSLERIRTEKKIKEKSPQVLLK